MPAEGRDPRRHSIRRHLSGHLRTLTLANASAAGHPELILYVLLQVGRLEVRAGRWQRLLAVIQLLPTVHDSVGIFGYLSRTPD